MKRWEREREGGGGMGILPGVPSVSILPICGEMRIFKNPNARTSDRISHIGFGGHIVTISHIEEERKEGKGRFEHTKP